MPVDPATLPGYQPPPHRPRPRRTWSRAILIFLGGSTFFLVFFLLAASDRALAPAFHATAIAAIVLFSLERLYTGFQEDGPLGALHRLRNPHGNLILGDDVEHTNRYSIALMLVLLVAFVLSGLLAATR